MTILHGDCITEMAIDALFGTAGMAGHWTTVSPFRDTVGGEEKRDQP